MADKEIIIDGVDVSECNFGLERNNQQKCECSHATGFGVICDCERWHNCYYKQLKRKEQECEELKREIAFRNNGKLSDKIRAIVFKNLNDENSKFKQGLDEIEEFIKSQLDDFGNDVYSMDKSAINNIQDIINNVKEE